MPVPLQSSSAETSLSHYSRKKKLIYSRLFESCTINVRKHRLHWMYISGRRWKKYVWKARNEDPLFTIFIHGPSSRSVPMLVNEHTTGGDVFEVLWRTGLAPKGVTLGISFSLFGSHKNLDLRIPLVQQGVERDCNIRMRVHLLGGADQDISTDSVTTGEAGPSRASRRLGTSSRMTQAIYEIGLNPNGEVPKKRHRAIRRPKPTNDHMADLCRKSNFGLIMRSLKNEFLDESQE
ncbi:hypothetical protein K435DRAFT_791607 [Dendrothele bispora CBS 962.96]|uniref:Uncharacterized protein n=1 Tax=Dendrothele bispora (strain CBS 962.96) TaxID=1314807 RepID=A0A4S8ML88_DENBC|nr:hypothetical protein K435DRAFT_791607 [Dendrothele bispora CBS 962.96]